MNNLKKNKREKNKSLMPAGVKFEVLQPSYYR